MKPTSTVLTAALGAASVAQAVTNTTFGFGHGVANYTDGHADNALWVNGEDACDYIYLGVFLETMCDFRGGWFEAPDGSWYQFTGCGTGIGNFCLHNEDHTLISCPTWSRYPHVGDGCSNEHGDYFVDRYFIF
ncbi:hypothetical protein UCDDA912_g03788 [Diaporthe ampelina]|uniref:Small secreted protein n=1 Tax=Diaporthe ampelina TaxID=1214573 RepID=A0A0G2FQG9_9PEZI|nr:hypothetical protein UCDDA912_g03788 [Diaporthe ampelina]